MDLKARTGPAVADLQASPDEVGAERNGVHAPVLLAGPRRRRSLGSRRQKIVAAIVILGALGFLVARGLANAMNYYLTANQAVAQRAQLGGTDFRIQGKVLPGVHQVGTTLALRHHFRQRRRQRGQHWFAAAAVPGGDAGRPRWPLAGERVLELPDNGPARLDLRRGPFRQGEERGARHVNIALGQSALLLALLGAVAGAVTLAGRARSGRPLLVAGRPELHMARRGRRRARHRGHAEGVDHTRLHPGLRRQQRQHLHARLIYRITAMWSDLAGSILLWALDPLGLPGRDVDPVPPAGATSRSWCGPRSSAT